MAREIVVLPQPDSPTRPERLPLVDARTSRRSRRARGPPRGRRACPCLIGKKILRWSTSTSAVAPSSPVGGLGGHALRRLLARQPDLAGLDLAPLALLLGRSQQRSWCSGSPSSRDLERRHLACTRSNSCGQRGRKWQPSGRSASDGGSPAIAGRRSGRGRSTRVIEPEQAPGVGVLRVVEDLVERALLHDAAARTSRRCGRRCRPPRRGRASRGSRRRRSRRAARGCARGSAPGSSRRARWWARPRSGSTGLHDSARAIITRWRMPPENSNG